MNQRDIENGITKFDALDSDGGDVSALLNGLPRVEAPGNFEFGVRSRIAAMRDSKPRSTFVPFLKIAGPLSLLLLVGAFIFYGTLPTANSPSIAGAPPVLKTDGDALTSVASEVPPQDSRPLMTEVVEPDNAIATSRPSNTGRLVQRRDTRGGSVDMPLGGGSLDQTLRPGRTILPPGFESVTQANQNVSSNGSTSGDVPVRDVLGILGITADFAGGWKVRSVAENSVASRAGVRAGDVIEAIDGAQLKADSSIKGSPTTFTILRDGKTINLSLKS